MTATLPLTEYLTLAVKVSRSARAALRAAPEQGQTVRRKPARDVQLEADVTLDRLIGDRLRHQTIFPILSEELGRRAQPNGAPVYWIVDPLDGSLNFMRGIPFSCISIALWRGRTPLLGVIHDVNRDECFSGIVGEGAWLNGQRIHVSATRDQSQAVLCTGFPVRRNFSTRALQDFVRQIQAYKKIRLLGSAALSLAYVACGRMDAYYEERIALWDVAAGIAILHAAGGTTQINAVGSDHTMTVMAGNRFLVGQAHPRSALSR